MTSHMILMTSHKISHMRVMKVMKTQRKLEPKKKKKSLQTSGMVRFFLKQAHSIFLVEGLPNDQLLTVSWSKSLTAGSQSQGFRSQSISVEFHMGIW